MISEILGLKKDLNKMKITKSTYHINKLACAYEIKKKLLIGTFIFPLKHSQFGLKKNMTK